MPNRTYSATNSYRYGFNGKENDNEVKGEGNEQDYGMRVYDPRVGRFLSMDPLQKLYPELTPYQFATNTPIQAIDLDGLESGKIDPATGKIIPIGPTYIKNPGKDRDEIGLILFYSPVKTNLTRPAQVSKLQQSSDYLTSVKVAQNHQIAVKKAAPPPKPDRDVVESDIYGVGHIGKQSVVEAQVQGIKAEYNNAIGESIRGGFFGAVGYLAEGDRGAFKGAVVDQVLMSFFGIPGSSSVLNKNFIEIPQRQEGFTPPKAYMNSNGQVTNGKYTIDRTAMEPHTRGDLSTGKSQFLFNVDANQAVLDAAIYADQHNLWNPANNSAKVPITNGNIGVLGKTGEQTDYINVYRTSTGFVHGSPGNPPKKP